MTRFSKIVLSSIALIGFLLFMWAGWANYVNLRLHVGFAEDQVKYFGELVQMATEHPTVEGITNAMLGVQNYYPSGTRQMSGSTLDLIVERSRAQAIVDLSRLTNNLSEHGGSGSPDQAQ